MSADGSTRLCAACECVYLPSETAMIFPACPSCSEAVAFVDVIIIHVLFHGVSLCNLPGVPRDWPRGHRWVTVECHDEATCGTCGTAAQERISATNVPHPA